MFKYNKKDKKHKNKIRKETLCAIRRKVKHSQSKTITQTKQSVQPDKKKVQEAFAVAKRQQTADLVQEALFESVFKM